MIFWITLAILGLITLGQFLRIWYEDSFWEGALIAFATAFVGSILGAILILGTGFLVDLIWHPEPSSQTTQTTDYKLRATSTGDGVNGNFFLGSGTIKDERVFSYLYKEGEWTHSDQAPARESRVAEDATAETAWMEKVVTDDYYSWWVPWVTSTKVEYSFHVPKDSVVEGYNISAK